VSGRWYPTDCDPDESLIEISFQETNTRFFRFTTKDMPEGLRTKKAILEWFDDEGRYMMNDTHASWVRDTKPQIESIVPHNRCPNHDTGWTDLPLPEHGGPEPSETKWHYRGRCHGAKPQHDDFCSHCTSSRKSGLRLLTGDEIQYLTRYPEWSDLRGKQEWSDLKSKQFHLKDLFTRGEEE